MLETKIVIFEMASRLESEVNRLLKLGWDLSGSLIVTIDPESQGLIYIQQLIKPRQ